MARAETQNASELEHVRWIAGGSGGGKTTLSRMLAERFGCRLYSSDKTTRRFRGYRPCAGWRSGSS